MIRWIFQGVLRDKTRSLFPFIVVTVGVGLVIFNVGFMDGVLMGMIDMTAKLDKPAKPPLAKMVYAKPHGPES